jgi:hypothetical protein
LDRVPKRQPQSDHAEGEEQFRHSGDSLSDAVSEVKPHYSTFSFADRMPFQSRATPKYGQERSYFQACPENRDRAYSQAANILLTGQSILT